MNPWFIVARDAARLAFDAHSVVARRLTHFARGTEFDWVEAQLMAVEKVAALAQVQVATALSLMSGERGPAIARKVIDIYGKSVQQNHQRLSAVSAASRLLAVDSRNVEPNRTSS